MEGHKNGKVEWEGVSSGARGALRPPLGLRGQMSVAQHKGRVRGAKPYEPALWGSHLVPHGLSPGIVTHVKLSSGGPFKWPLTPVNPSGPPRVAKYDLINSSLGRGPKKVAYRCCKRSGDIKWPHWNWGI